MTDTQFWAKLEKYGKDGEAFFDLIEAIRMAYDQNLGMICGCVHTGPDLVNQLYLNINEREPNRPGNRYMLCYTSWAMAKADTMLPEPCEKLPVRFVVDNMLNKPVIGGLIFNRGCKEKGFVVPKQFLGDGATVFNAIKDVFSDKPNPLNIPW